MEIGKFKVSKVTETKMFRGGYLNEDGKHRRWEATFRAYISEKNNTWKLENYYYNGSDPVGFTYSMQVYANRLNAGVAQEFVPTPKVEVTAEEVVNEITKIEEEESFDGIFGKIKFGF